MTKRRAFILIGVLAAVLFLSPLVVPIFWPWSAINCRYEDINIKTGQARYSRSLWFVTMGEHIEDTPLSLALQGETVDVKDIPAWQRVCTFSFGTGHSPHHRFHAALWQAQQIEMIASVGALTPAEKRKAARDILTAWQKSGDDHGAKECLENLEKKAISKSNLDSGGK
jgi:hypothetical protein